MRKFSVHIECIAIESKLLNKIMPTSEHFRFHINKKFTYPEGQLASVLYVVLGGERGATSPLEE